MPPPLKPSVSIRPNPVKEYVRKSGEIVSAHISPHKIADKLIDRIIPKRAIVRGAQGTAAKPSQIPSGPLDIPNTTATQAYTVYGEKNTSRVAHIQNKDGTSQWFKSRGGEAWRYKDKDGLVHLIRSSVVDDRLGDRECAASDIAKELGVDSIPNTYKTKVAMESGAELGTGSVQEDVSSHLRKLGDYNKTNSLMEWVNQVPSVTQRVEGGKSTTELVQIGSETYDSMLGHALDERSKDIQHLMGSVLRNGGMDTSYFDFIIGNMDRHGANLLVGKNDSTGEYKPVGIDNGLSFPNSDTLNEKDFANSAKVEWKMATVFGAGIECSANFKSKIASPDIDSKLESHMARRGLTDSEKHGVLTRLSSVRSEFQKSGKLNGATLKGLLDKSIVK